MESRTVFGEMKAGLLPVYLLSAAMAAAVYIFLYSNTQLTLLPYTKTLSSIFGFHFYFTGMAYEAAGCGLVISSTCSGINMFLSVYFILVLGFLHYFESTKRRLGASLVFLPSALFVTYFFTLARIILSLPFCDSQHFKLIHTAISFFIFFGTGFLVYMSMQKILGRIKNGIEYKTV